MHSKRMRPELKRKLDQVGLNDGWLYKRMFNMINAGTSGNNLATTKPMVALAAIRTVLELKDRFPSIRVQQESTKIDVSLKASNLDELKQMLGQLHQKTEKFLSASTKAK